MESPNSLEKAALLARASTADVYACGSGQVLKLFYDHTPWHANEVAATKVAHETHLAFPKVIEGLIEVGEREGIVFERIDGPVMTEFIEDHPDQIDDCAKKAAELHARIHSTAVSELPPLAGLLAWSIQQAEPLEEGIRKAVLDMLTRLPDGEMLCHNDFHPTNIIVSSRGLMIIDWAIGTRGNPLADLARTWLISKMWLDGLEADGAPEHSQLLWHRFWETYFRQYRALRPFNALEFIQWQIVAASASLVWDQTAEATDQRVSFIKAALSDAEHQWLCRIEEKDGCHE